MIRPPKEFLDHRGRILPPVEQIFADKMAQKRSHTRFLSFSKSVAPQTNVILVISVILTRAASNSHNREAFCRQGTSFGGPTDLIRDDPTFCFDEMSSSC